MTPRVVVLTQPRRALSLAPRGTTLGMQDLKTKSLVDITHLKSWCQTWCRLHRRCVKWANSSWGIKLTMRSSPRHGSGLLLLTLLLTFQATLFCEEIASQTIMVGSASMSRMPAIKNLTSYHVAPSIRSQEPKSPRRLPRGFSSLIVSVVYHPHWTTAENNTMREHLFQSLLLAESRYPNCALILAGDFNHLDVKSKQANGEKAYKKGRNFRSCLD